MMPIAARAAAFSGAWLPQSARSVSPVATAFRKANGFRRFSTPRKN